MDKELLINAGKAIGRTGSYIEQEFKGTVINSGIAGTGWNGADILWNPIRNDGDAFCLGVRLGMFADGNHELFKKYYYEELDNDLKPTEATRRAITRVAADIGKLL